MKTNLSIIVSLLLLFNTSAALAGGHKSKVSKGGDDVVTEIGGGQDFKGKKDKQEKHNKDSEGDDRQDDDNQLDKDNAGKGSERSQEMRDRRDERKEIQGEYRSNREPGQESNKGEEGKPTKKPWYKFWE